MTQEVDFLLIGGGLASTTTAETLRSDGAQGSIVMLAAEPVLPYHRPPLSKDYLLKDEGFDRLLIQPEAFYRDHNIEVRFGTRATHLDAQHKLVTTGRAGTFRYRQLLIATGARARRLRMPGAQLDGVHYLRTVTDAERLRNAMATSKQAVVVASSFIAMEVAAACITRGIQTTIIAKEKLLYDRLESPEVSTFFYDYYRARGIEIVFGETVSAFTGEQQVSTVTTQSGRAFACDLAVIGAGAEPEIEFLRDSGLRLEDGVVVNQYLETHFHGVYAAGDIAKFFDPVFRRNRRIEHWDNALKQGRIVARNMLGCHESYRAVSYFFSDVLDLSFNFIGDVDGTTRRIVRGAPASSSFAVLYLRDEQLTAGFLLNRPVGEERAIGSLLLNRIPLEQPQTLGDISLPLSTWAKQTVLILQGGGALGAFECGAVKALEENGIHADVVAGVSIGAFNAAIVASHPRRAAAALEAFWRELAIYTPAAPNEEARRALSSWYALVFGVPKFFRPRWLMPMLSVQEWSHNWMSFYDPSPIKDLLRKYVDFKQLKYSPVRLLVNAVNVETAEVETFDSYIEEITPDHLVASGSLPPGFPWTTIHGKHYWDGGIVSNSPIDQVTERCGLTDKRVYIVNLFPGSKRLPRNLPEVMARRDEIVYAERLNRDVRTRDLLDNYGKLVNELMSELDPTIAEPIKQRPLYIETIGTTGPISVTRIVHTGEPGEGPSKDYEFSAETVEEHIEGGYIAACQALKATGK
ncbi:MAG: FAD-dependent oxidoreductase [Gammaproteobacteria bacterium]|nr:FAD-dependent oxidoreductase [Gammaproteobacteria bacterium]